MPILAPDDVDVLSRAVRELLDGASVTSRRRTGALIEPVEVEGELIGPGSFRAVSRSTASVARDMRPAALMRGLMREMMSRTVR